MMELFTLLELLLPLLQIHMSGLHMERGCFPLCFLFLKIYFPFRSIKFHNSFSSPLYCFHIGKAKYTRQVRILLRLSYTQDRKRHGTFYEDLNWDRLLLLCSAQNNLKVHNFLQHALAPNLFFPCWHCTCFWAWMLTQSVRVWFSTDGGGCSFLWEAKATFYTKPSE